MKTRLALFGFLLTSTIMFAQSPENFKYQAVLRDASGNVEANKVTTIQLSILQGSSSGSIVYSETHSVTTNPFGLMNLTVGAGTSPSGNFTAIDWSNGPYFLSVTVNGIAFGTSQLLSVPYALFSKTAGNGFSGNYTDLKNKPTLFDGNWISLTGKPTTIGGFGITDAFSGNYNDLTNKPILFDGSWTKITGKPTFATIATSGSYIDLTNTPDFSLYYTKTNLQTSGQAQMDAGNITSGMLNVAHGGTGVNSLSGIVIGNGTGALTSVSQTGGNQYFRSNEGNTAFEFGTLSTVAGSGDYNDLANKPTILNSTNFSTATGISVLQSNSGYGNTANGYQALYSNTNGGNNTSSGYRTLSHNTSGDYNTASGSSALFYNTTGSWNVANGSDVLFSNTTGTSNTANGYQALFSNTTGNDNTGNGAGALYTNTTGFQNTANGTNALYYNTTGYYNTAIGFQALSSNTTGSHNTATGVSALWFNTAGSYNTANGISVLWSNNTGACNTANGYHALFNNTTGNYNSAMGYSAGSNVTTGSNLTLLGSYAQPSSTTATNQVTLGDNNVTSLRCNTQTITSLSDARDKMNIRDLSLGLNFIMQVKPRQFNWDKREWYTNHQSDGSKMKHSPSAGFIAQELDQAQIAANAEWLNIVLKDNPEKWEATYGNLLPVMVKAIQEQQKLIEELKKENDLLKLDLNGRIQRIEAMLKVLK